MVNQHKTPLDYEIECLWDAIIKERKRQSTIEIMQKHEESWFPIAPSFSSVDLEKFGLKKEKGEIL